MVSCIETPVNLLLLVLLKIDCACGAYTDMITPTTIDNMISKGSSLSKSDISLNTSLRSRLREVETMLVDAVGPQVLSAI